MNYKNYIAIVEDFPIKGISFKDITPLLQNGDAFKAVTKDLAKFAEEVGATVIVGPESRGFIFGCPVAVELGLGFVPIRKPGKLPREVVKKEYSLEYGSNTLCMHADALKKGDKVFVEKDNMPCTCIVTGVVYSKDGKFGCRLEEVDGNSIFSVYDRKEVYTSKAMLKLKLRWKLLIA